MARTGVVAFALAALLVPASARASVFASPASPPRVQGTKLPPGFAETTAWTVPDAVTAVRFAPDGHVFVAGKSGVVYAFDGLGDRTRTVVANRRAEVYDGFDRGLLGLAVDPGYATGRPYLYVAYTYDRNPVDGSAWHDGCSAARADRGSCPATGRISRLGPGGTETVLADGFCDQFQSHSLGALTFGPDGALYAGAGDGASFLGLDYGQHGVPVNPCADPPVPRGTAPRAPAAQGGALRAQSYRRPAGQPVSLDGALLRLDPDHPTRASRAPIVAYGLRHPFRFAFRPGTAELWLGDVGFDTWEEIDRDPDVSQVRNYGWPCYEGDAAQPLYRRARLAACASLYRHDDTVKPLLAYRHGRPLAGCPGRWSAVSGLAFYSGRAFPARYRGALFFADFARGCIWAMRPGADGTPDPTRVSLFASGAAGPADLEVGPDGALYYADVFDGEIRRIAALGERRRHAADQAVSSSAAPSSRATSAA